MKSRTIGLSWFVPSRRAQAAFTYFDFKVYQNLTGEIGKSECCVLFFCCDSRKCRKPGRVGEFKESCNYVKSI